MHGKGGIRLVRSARRHRSGTARRVRADDEPEHDDEPGGARSGDADPRWQRPTGDAEPARPAGFNGRVGDGRAYDAFGGVRNGDLSDKANGALDLDPTALRGFTGHEHMDAVKLIRMNGILLRITSGQSTMDRLIVAALVAATLCMSSCVKKEDRLSSISEIIHQRETLDGKRILVRGYIVVDVLDHPSFVEERGLPSGDRITKSIDLVPHDDQVQRKLAALDGACVVVDGILQLYGPHRIPIAGLVSVYGQIDARAIRKCGGGYK